MAVPQSHAAPVTRSEEAAAATTIVLGLSAAVGGMAGGIGLVSGSGLGWLVAPTAVLLAMLATGRIINAAWSGVVLWAGLLPHARADAMLGPLLMIVACLAIALGPDRLLAIVLRDLDVRAAKPDRAPRAGRDAVGWIEDA
jgi:hypothetical protein